MNRSPIKWHGGKTYLADRIVELMPGDAVHYVEPYAGGLSVLLSREPGASEVVNDIDGALVNFWRVLADRRRFAELRRRLEATPLSRDVFNAAATALTMRRTLHGRKFLGAPSVAWAAVFFVVNRQSRQALGRDFATLSRRRTRGGLNEQASAWLSAIDGLPTFAERIRGVVIENVDAIELIRREDGPATLYYLDPPYPHETRSTTDAYRHEMTPEQHEELLETLETLEGRFVLSTYPNEQYTRTAERCSWHLEEIAIDNKAAGGRVKPRKREQLWLNYDPTTGRRTKRKRGARGRSRGRSRSRAAVS